MKLIRLTESDLHRIVEKSVANILAENEIEEGWVGDIKGGQRLSKTLCHFFMVFPYTLIFATSISLRYLKIISNWLQITENSAFYKPLTIRRLIFTVDFMRCKSYQIRL